MHVHNGPPKKMGSGASQLNQGLKCPSGYDPEDFQAICTLFDSFDTNGDFVVSGSELSSIASVHVQNKIMKSRRKVDTLKTKQDAIKQQSQLRLEVEINAITREIETSVNRDLSLIDNRIKTLKQDIACWEIANARAEARLLRGGDLEGRASFFPRIFQVYAL